MKISIRWKILFFILLPIVAIYSVFMVFNILKMRQWAATTMENQIRETTEHYAHRLDHQLQEAAMTAELTAAYVEKTPALTPDMMVSMLTAHLEKQPLLYGSAIAFAPFAYSSEKELFIRYVHRQGNRLVTSGFVFEGYDYTDPQHDYWHKPRLSGKPNWTEPYFDQGGGDLLMCTYSVPFYRDGRFTGITLVDIPLEPLRNIALAEVPETVKLTVLTPSGKFVYNADHSRINRRVTDIEEMKTHEGLLQFAETAASGRAGIVRLRNWDHSEPEIVAFTPVSTTGWGLTVSMTEAWAFAAIQRGFYVNLAFFLLSLMVLVPALWFFTSRITRSIFRLNGTVTSFAKGNRNARADSDRNDELGQLGAAFNQMAAELNEREKNLIDARQMFEAVITQSPVPICVVLANGTIYSMNPACIDFFKDKTDMRSGTNLMDLIPSWKDYDTNGHRIPIKDAPIVAAINGRVTKNLEIQVVSDTQKERWIIANAAPVVDDRGNVIAGVVVFPDITERKKIEENLRESEERFRRIAENAKDMIFRLSLPDGRYEYVSPAAETMIGYTPEEFYHTPSLTEKIIHPEWLSFYKENWDRLCDGETPPNYEFKIIHKTGQIKWLHQRNVLIKDKAGKPIALEGIATDVTEAKLAEEEKTRLEADLRQAQKMEAVGGLAGGIAHDFNNILSAILGYAELAKDDIPASNPAIHELNEVIKAGKRARDLVKQILAFSRKSVEERVPVKPDELVVEALHLIRASIPSYIEIRQNIDPDCGEILADPTQIHQVVMNICTNAAHSMEETGGVLEVALSVAHLLKDHDKDPGAFVKLTIRDTGCGIKKENLERIFDPYFTTKEFGKGSGMGLAIVHGIVEGHNGKISVISRPGVGTVFHIFFPKITEKTTRVSEPRETIEKGFEKILVVDDEKTMARVTAETLKRLGYNVTLRTSSAEAFDLFAADPAHFDLVITDQTMPKMTGEQMSQKMMALRSDIPVILCTGYSSKIDKAKAERMGIKAFLMKPVSRAELAGTIRRVLDRQALS